MKSLLIQDTTREEREQIVRDSLGYCDIGCEEPGGSYDFYEPYIEGRMELRELSMNARTGFVREIPDSVPHSCLMGY